MPSHFALAKQWLPRWALQIAEQPKRITWLSFIGVAQWLESEADVVAQERTGKPAFTSWEDIPASEDWPIRQALIRLSSSFLHPPRRALLQALSQAGRRGWDGIRSDSSGALYLLQRNCQPQQVAGPLTPGWVDRAAEYWWRCMFNRQIVEMVSFLAAWGACNHAYRMDLRARQDGDAAVPDEDKVERTAWYVLIRSLDELLGRRRCYVCDRTEPLRAGRRTRGSALAARAGHVFSFEHQGRKVDLAPWVCKQCALAWRNLFQGKTPGYEESGRPREREKAARATASEWFFGGLVKRIIRCLKEHPPPFA